MNRRPARLFEAALKARPLTCRQVADRWGCSDNTVRSLIHSGELPAFRAGKRLIRIPLKSVKDYECQTLQSEGSTDDLSSHGGKAENADVIVLRHATKKTAEAEAIDIYRHRTIRVTETTVESLWSAYRAEKGGRRVATAMRHEWKAVGPQFGTLRHDQVTIDTCRSYTKLRRKQGKQDGTIWTELGHLRTVFIWANKRQLIDHAPVVERTGDQNISGSRRSSAHKPCLYSHAIHRSSRKRSFGSHMGQDRL